MDLDQDVIPLQFCGVIDTELSKISTNKLMLYALANIEHDGQEGRYVVQHCKFVFKFEQPRPGIEEDKLKKKLINGCISCLVALWYWRD